MVGPKYRKTVGGYIGWAAGTLFRYLVLVGSGVAIYKLCKKALKNTIHDEIENESK